jgi:hypothetical protein
MLAFKILCFQKKKNSIACNLKKQFFAFSNRNFFKKKTQFPNDSFFAIWFKIVFFPYEIAITNAP